MKPFTKQELRGLLHQSAVQERNDIRSFKEKGAELGLHPKWIKGILSGIRCERREQRKKIRELAVMAELMRATG